MRYLLILIAKDIYSVHGNRLWLLILLMVVVALGEGLAMTLLLPLISVLGIDTSTDANPINIFVNSIFSLFGFSESIIGTLLLIVFVFAVQATLFISQTWWVAKLQRIYGAYWQRRLFESFMYAKWGFITNHKMGELTNLITQETLRVSGAFMIVAQSSATIMIIFVYLTVALLLSWQITLALLGLAATLFLTMKGISKKTYAIGSRISQLNSEQMVLLSEFIGGAKLIKASSTEARATREINKLIEQLRISHTWATFYPGLTKGVFEFGSIVALCIILVIGHLHLETPAGYTLLILALFVRLLPRFNALQQNIQLLNTFLPAFNQVKNLYQEAHDNTEEREPDGSIPEGAFSFTGVHAGFNGENILNNLNLELPEKGLIGIVGESGAGKSTLVHLMLYLCDLNNGDLKCGETSISTCAPTVWRRSIGYVPQETILFHRSVRDNIAWTHETASNEEIISAAKKAKAHNFIESLPEGYDTIIGDQGLRLSGGQRQRLGIARALINNPKYLLLDEATSALDSASEQGVLETLELLRKEMCIISVAHRLATIKHADEIIVMEGGSVVEKGEWTKLFNAKGALYNLALKQNIST